MGVETNAMIVSSFLIHEGIGSIEDFTDDLFPESVNVNDPKSIQRWLYGRVHSFLSKEIMPIPIFSDLIFNNENEAVQCRGQSCELTFQFEAIRKHHKSVAHDINYEDNSDYLYEYSWLRLGLGLLLMDADDAIKEGDGHRLIRLYGIITFLFKLLGHTKYAYSGLRLKAAELALLSPSRFHELQ